MDHTAVITALISAFVSLFVLLMTVLWDKATRHKERNEDATPFFATIDYGDSNTLRAQDHTFVFTKKGTYGTDNRPLVVNIINSDKVEFIIDRFTVNGVDYRALSRELVEKQMCFSVRLHINEKIDLEKSDIKMHITDINHKKRCYTLITDDMRVIDIKGD